MSATSMALTATSSLPLAVAVLVAGGLAGLLASLVLLRYADTIWAGWLLDFGTTNSGEVHEQGSENPADVAAAVPRQPTVGAESAHAGNPANEPEPLDHLAADFAVHAQAVRAQVSRYADLLADGDAVLRARLRRIEDTRSSSAPPSTSRSTSGGAW